MVFYLNAPTVDPSGAFSFVAGYPQPRRSKIVLMIRVLLILCLVFTSLGSVVAQTRMAAAGGYCGTGAPQILLDAAGLPLLDANGTAIAVADCPACCLVHALSAPTPGAAAYAVRLLPVSIASRPTPHVLDRLQRTQQARAPPAVA